MLSPNAVVLRGARGGALVESTSPLPVATAGESDATGPSAGAFRFRSAPVETSLASSSDGWTYTTATPGVFSGSVQTGALGFGQYQSSTTAAIDDGEFGWWRYVAPRESFVYRVDIAGLTHTPAGPDATCVTEGIFNGADWEQGGEWSQGGVVGGSGPWSSCGSVSVDSKTFCASVGCGVDGAPGSSAAVRQSASGTGTRSSAGETYVAGATVYLSDDEDPYLLGSQAPSSWFSSGLANWQVDARDDGLGVAKVSYSGPNSLTGDLVEGCTGLHDDRCPAQWTPTLSVDTAVLPEGENAIELVAHDIIDRASTPVATTLRVDRTAPQVGYTGAIVATEGRTIAGDVGVQVDAADGDPTTKRSGVRSIQVLVDGVQKDFAEQPCPEGSCALSRSWTLAPSQYTAGTHVVQVIVKDWADNQTGRSFDVKVGAGRITSVNEGQRTARRVPLRAEGASDHDNVRFQYRKSATAEWSDIPVGTVRTADGQSLSSWPVELTDDRSPQLTWDLVGSPGSPGMISAGHLKRDASLQIRGLFAGGPAGTTQELWVTLDRAGANTNSALAPIGPGQVDLVTGEFQFTQTDVNIPAYKADLVVSRTYGSRGGKKSEAGMLGYGWTVSIPHSSASYTSLENLAQRPPAPEPSEEDFDAEFEAAGPQPYVIVYGADGEEIVFSEEGTGYKPDAGYETLKLERVVSPTNPAVIDRFRLTDLDSGEVITFTPKGNAGSYRLSSVRMHNDAATFEYGEFVYATVPVTGQQLKQVLPTRMIAAAAPGIDCSNGLVRGCRALSFSYASITGATRKRLTQIDYTAWDPATSQMKTTTVAQYNYVVSLQQGGKLGTLRNVDDPRKGTTVEWGFTHDTHGRIVNINPTSQVGWLLIYEPVATDPAALDSSGQTPATGRLKAVSRAKNTQTFISDGNAANLQWTMAYDVPVSGSGAPYPMAATDVAAWGQQTPPVTAAAVFRADDVPTDPPASYAKASVHYLDALGREINVAAPGGHITTTELDASGNVVRELSAANRARALATGTSAEEHAAKAATVDTQRRFDASRVRLLEEFGPEHDVDLESGGVVRARRRITYAYDEGAPATGGPFNLPTTTTVGARVAGETSDRDVRTSKTAYDWTLRQPTQQTIDPDGLNLRTGTVFDTTTGLPVERRLPRSPAGGDASATRTIYWTAATNGEDAACGARPEWAGDVCRTKPVVQPNTPGLPDLPVASTQYGYLGQPTVVDEEAGAATRQTTFGYDLSGRLTSEETVSSTGTPLGRRTIDYGSGACDVPEKWRIYIGADWHEFLRTNDTWCRFYNSGFSKSWVNSGSTSQIERVFYDRSENVVQRTIGGVQQNFTIDPVRALPSALSDPAVGTVNVTRDEDGQITEQTFATSAITVMTTYDETGTPTRRRYVKGGTCTQDCTLLDDQVTESIHGQWLTHDGLDSDQQYSYDDAGRLEQVTDTDANGCVTRRYVFDANSNRTASSTAPAGTGGACSDSGANSISHIYDAADRITDSGYEYDAFGRITRVPAADAGGSALNSAYYVNDRVHTTEQAGRSVTLTLDGLLRPRARTETNTHVEELYYGDTGDKADYSWKNGKRTRYIDGLDGEMIAIDREGDVRLQLTNLHGDVVGEIAYTAAAAAPSATWETDEFGVPKAPVRPAIELVDSTTNAPAATTNTLQLTKPSEAQEGDLLLAGIGMPGTTPAPAGWTLAHSAGVYYGVYWRRVTDSEPTTYTFTSSATGKARGGILVLRNADTTAPINAKAGSSGSSTAAPAIPAIFPTTDDAAIVTFAGMSAGDADGGGAWTFPSPLTEQWDITTGSTTSDGNHASAIHVQINGANTNLPSQTIPTSTGLPATFWASIAVAIAPKRQTKQYRYRYLGAKSRPAELPSGVIGMGARLYVPQIGRFLQTDPLYGGSCNAYDYTCGDPLNMVDLDGHAQMPNSAGAGPSGGGFPWGGRGTPGYRPKPGPNRSKPAKPGGLPTPRKTVATGCIVAAFACSVISKPTSRINPNTFNAAKGTPAEKVGKRKPRPGKKPE